MQISLRYIELNGAEIFKSSFTLRSRATCRRNELNFQQRHLPTPFGTIRNSSLKAQPAFPIQRCQDLNLEHTRRRRAELSGWKLCPAIIRLSCTGFQEPAQLVQKCFLWEVGGLCCIQVNCVRFPLGLFYRASHLLEGNTCCFLALQMFIIENVMICKIQGILRNCLFDKMINFWFSNLIISLRKGANIEKFCSSYLAKSQNH